MRRTALALVASVAMTMPATAAPKGAGAKSAFTKGVAAYKKGAFDTASEALAKSYALEADPDTLFAWAQSERQRGKCDKAIELFEKLLAYELPDANKQAIREKLAECKAIVGAQKPAPVEPPPAPVQPVPEPAPAPAPVVSTPEPMPATDAPEARAWWKDPVGGALVGAGIVGLGVGGYFMLSARSADRDADAATNYFDFEEHTRRAEARGRNGVIAAVAGGAFLGAGIIWYATRGSARSESTTISTWLVPSGAGVFARTRF